MPLPRIAVWALALATLGLVEAPPAVPEPLSAPQTITVTVHAPSAAAFNDAFNVAASASSGMAVTYTSSGSCTNSGAMFTITSGAGTCLVRYDQPGGGGFAPAPQVVESVTAHKSNQTIGFEQVGPQTFGGPDIAVSALATSGLPVSLAATGNCSVSGAIVHLKGPGSCTLTASQPGNTDWNAAPPASITFAIAPKPTRCIVPDVRNKRLAAAKAALARAHCGTGSVRSAYSTASKKGRVVSQSRRPGRVLPAGSKVALVIGRGRRR